MRRFKSHCFTDLNLISLNDNKVIEQVYSVRVFMR